MLSHHPICILLAGISAFLERERSVSGFIKRQMISADSSLVKRCQLTLASFRKRQMVFFENVPSNVPVFICIQMLLPENIMQKKYRKISMTGMPFSFPALHLKSRRPMWNLFVNFVAKSETLFPLAVIYLTWHKSPCCAIVFGDSIIPYAGGLCLFILPGQYIQDIDCQYAAGQSKISNRFHVTEDADR